MACRCSELDIYRSDRKILYNIYEKIGEISAKDAEVEETLTSIANVMPDTIIVPDEGFSYKIKCQNNKTKCAIGIMNAHVVAKYNEIDEIVKALEKEDKAYHRAHPIETFLDWIEDLTDG